MNIIESKSLTKIYGIGQTAVKALNNVNLKIKEGDFLAVMGPSGCGKTTLLHMLGGLDNPTSGSIFLEGADISNMKDNQLTKLRRKKLALYFNILI